MPPLTGEFIMYRITCILLSALFLIALCSGRSAAQGCSAPVFSAAVPYGAGVDPYGIAAADFNGDGKADLATANYSSNTVSILLGNGNGTFGAAANFAAGGGPVALIAPGDLTGDGKLDIVFASWYTNSITILPGNGLGGFGSGTSFGVGATPRALAAADLNGDGKLDVVVANSGAGTISVLLGNGTGGFSSNTTYAAGATPCSVVIGDFNGDGKPDIVSANADAVNLTFFAGTGTGTFAAAVPIGLPGKPSAVAAADLNGDGKLDLAVTCANISFVTILLGNGNGTFGSPVNFSTGAFPLALVIRDFTNDGKLDVASVNANANNVSVFAGDGLGGFGNATNFAAGSNPRFLCSADFNGDGTSDIATANFNGNNISVLLNACPINHAPYAICKNVTVSAGASCTAAASIDNGSYDPDAGDTIELAQSPPGPYPKGSTTVVLTVTDNHGLSSSCTGVVTVADDTPPLIACPGDITVAADPGLCEKANVTWSATATDNCPGVNVVCAPASSSTFLKGATPVVCTAIDASGNTAACSFTVTVLDQEPPSISCPGSITASADPGACTAVVSFTATVADNCPGAAYACAPPSGSAFDKGVTQVACTATDASGNSASCGFSVTVVDTQPPVLACPASFTVPTDPGLCTAVVPYSVTVTDNCPGASFTCSPASGATFDKGVTTVNCSAVDASGNGAQCSFTVTVADQEPPAITCPDDITLPAEFGHCSATVTYSASVTDNCPGAAYACVPPSGSVFEKGTTVVTCSAVDASGNSASCGFSVTVNDTQWPVLACPASFTVPTDPGLCAANVSYAVTVSDNCPGASVACAPPSGSVFPKGVTTVNCTGVDASGNSVPCSFTVTVVDQEAPVLSCPAAVTHNTDPGSCSAPVSFTVTVADNCPGATFACAPPSGSTFAKGATTVNCAATDAAGNSAACSFPVTVVDAQYPAMTVSVAPASLWPANKQMVDIAAVVNVSDTCAGASFVLQSIADNEGSDPADVAGAAYGTPDLAFQLRAKRISKSAPRIYTITYVATDGAGNATTVTASVTVPLKHPKEAAPAQGAALPEGIVLQQNFPNPFNPTTRIGFSIGEPLRVRLAIFDIFSRETAVLVDEVRPAGVYEEVFDASLLPSGTYFAILSAGGESRVIKMTLVK